MHKYNSPEGRFFCLGKVSSIVQTDTAVNLEKLAIFVFLWLDTNGSVPVTYLTEGTVQIQYFLCGVLNRFPWVLKDQIFYTPQRTVEI